VCVRERGIERARERKRGDLLERRDKAKDVGLEDHSVVLLQCVAVCCSVLQCVAVSYGTCMNQSWRMQDKAKDVGLQDHSVVLLQCVAVCCSVLQ